MSTYDWRSVSRQTVWVCNSFYFISCFFQKSRLPSSMILCPGYEITPLCLKYTGTSPLSNQFLDWWNAVNVQGILLVG